MAFLSLLTPCVFPMIPITVSYFIHQGEVGERKPLSNAIIYTLGIIATFSILGFILALHWVLKVPINWQQIHG